MKYTTGKNNKTRVILIIVCAVLMIAAFMIAYSLMNAAAESYLSTCWAMCKPGAQVNVRRAPDGGSKVEGFLEAGDTFLTDGTCQDGWVKAYGVCRLCEHGGTADDHAAVRLRRKEAGGLQALDPWAADRRPEMAEERGERDRVLYRGRMGRDEQRIHPKRMAGGGSCMNEFDTRCEMLTKKMRAALIKSAVLYMIYMDEEEIKTIAQLLEQRKQTSKAEEYLLGFEEGYKRAIIDVVKKVRGIKVYGGHKKGNPAGVSGPDAEVSALLLRERKRAHADPQV